MAIQPRSRKGQHLSWVPRFLLMIEAALKAPKPVQEQGKHGIVFRGEAYCRLRMRTMMKWMNGCTTELISTPTAVSKGRWGPLEIREMQLYLRTWGQRKCGEYTKEDWGNSCRSHNRLSLWHALLIPAQRRRTAATTRHQLKRHLGSSAFTGERASKSQLRKQAPSEDE